MGEIEKIHNIKEISLGDIKDCRFNYYKLIKIPFLNGRYSLIPSFKIIFKNIIFPLGYLIFGPVLSLILDKKIYENFKKNNSHFFFLNVHIENKIPYLFEKFFYLIVGLFMWIITPFFILNSIIEVFIRKIFLNNYNWDELKKSIGEFGYSPEHFFKGYMIVDQNNILKDGNHRYKLLCEKYGNDYIVNVKEKNVQDYIPYKYDWDGLKKSIDKHGYNPKKNKNGYLKVKKIKGNNSFNFNYTLIDGNHRHKLLCEKYGNNHSLEVKIRKRLFPKKWEIKEIELNKIYSIYTNKSISK
jgi:hypothetical protein